MRRTIPFFLAMLLLLSGCGRGDRDAEWLLSARTRALSAACVMEASVTADYGDRVYEFTLCLEEEAPGEGIVAVLTPETLAGVTMSYTAEGSALRYDDLTLDTGELAGTGLSPMEALPALLRSWRSGAVTSTGREKIGETETVLVRCDASEDAEETVEHLLWLEEESGRPVQMEIVANGYAAFRCTVDSFELIEKEGTEDGTGDNADVGGS
ncbi:MAG TPA: hypothetical protein PK597_04620 [Oscillospiraceae bacterium]|nr:hypothetical protein [Oscillospiraceae bacterium]